MLLLIPTITGKINDLQNNLQYTLLLLILPELESIISTCPLFTIHFATINTEFTGGYVVFTGSFTIHFATINTVYEEWLNEAYLLFTIHFATINTS